MNRLDWAKQFLTYVDMPQTPDNLVGLVTWMASEGSEAAFNPLATTQPAVDTTDFNSAGVKNYPDLHTGLAATGATLLNGLYAPIIAALERGDSATHLIDTISQSPWGSHPTPALLHDVQAQPDTYNNVLIGGSPVVAPDDQTPPDTQTHLNAPPVVVPDDQTPPDTQTHLNAPIVGMALVARAQADGYWLVGADGGVFPFGQARDYGNATTLKLARPIVGIVSSPTGEGYWLVAADGGVFAYGDAAPMGNIPELGIEPAQ